MFRLLPINGRDIKKIRGWGKVKKAIPVTARGGP
jgi:hypothetical protein